MDVNVTEILVSNKRNLEREIKELQSKFTEMQHNYTTICDIHNSGKQNLRELEYQLSEMKEKYKIANEDVQAKNNLIHQLNVLKTSLLDEKNDLVEQLEFTKSVLISKENENASLHSQLSNLQNQLDAMHLQLQQLTNGSITNLNNLNNNETDQVEVLLQKISNLEEKLKLLQKEKDQINSHYEHYTSELNEQMKLVLTKNEELTREIHNLSNRECSLIEQISDMEIRLQNFQSIKYDNLNTNNHNNFDETNELQESCKKAQEQLQELNAKLDELQIQNMEKETKIQELLSQRQNDCTDNLSITKLNDDITSNKVAAQRAMEQNKKLKLEVHELEEAFIKMSGDKLELTEKLTAEKFLNRELTIKLAEIDEKAKELSLKLKAKDDEMIRLQSCCREMEKTIKKLSELNENEATADHQLNEHFEKGDNVHGTSECEHQTLTKVIDENNSLSIQKEDAMLKLQERFLNIMNEVADLSDEKHRLEHIILQLQNETDTICEYIALYQQQRILLKKRDEERSTQIKIFQSECERLRSQIEEISKIITVFSTDKELISYFHEESRQNDMNKLMNMLLDLKNNSLIDSQKKSNELENFYPCNCCSGNLIDV